MKIVWLNTRETMIRGWVLTASIMICLLICGGISIAMGLGLIFEIE